MLDPYADRRWPAASDPLLDAEAIPLVDPPHPALAPLAFLDRAGRSNPNGLGSRLIDDPPFGDVGVLLPLPPSSGENRGEN